MHLGPFFVWAALLGATAADAPFEQVRRKKNIKDMSGRRGDPAGKYFHESTFHPHYDGRFTNEVLSDEDQKFALKQLVRAYLATFEGIGVSTWLMHGTLLGWWWNKKIMPWDSDIDVQVSEPSMYYLAEYYNMSVFRFHPPQIAYDREFMLEVNPHYKNREQTDRLNVIDARWIDMDTGLFIDITTARYNMTHPAGLGILSCKDGHEYRDTYIYPLLKTEFEENTCWIPFKYRDLLEAEYGTKALFNKKFRDHVFDEREMEWLPEKKPDSAVKKQKQGKN